MKSRFTIKAIATVTFLFAFSIMAQAQATRTWVSGVGDDVNPCSRTAPCKTYAGAISKTAKDGEISTLDPGGFGTVTITKSITINGGGGGQGYGSILAALTNGVIVNITDAADVRKTVRLDGLNINGASTGLDGIRFLNGNALHVEDCIIDGFTGDGIDVTNATNVAAKVYINNTSIRNCVGNGIILQNTNALAGSLVLASIDTVQIVNGGDGLEVNTRARATIRNSSISSMTGAGVRTAGTADAEANVDNCSLTYNPSAVRVDIGTARVADSVVSGNTNGLHNVGGTLKSFQTNRIDGNTSNTNGIVTNIAQS